MRPDTPLVGRRRRMLAGMAGLVVLPTGVWGQTPSEQRLAQLMQARRGPLDAAAERERLGLLARGEGLMAAGALDEAQAAFDAASLMLHAADSEIALVRCYMQRGEYRRAIAFGAHAAGAHRESSAAALLYAWLLQLGGQAVFAARLLDDALQRRPGDPLLAEARASLRPPPEPVRWPLAGPFTPPPVPLGPLPLGDASAPDNARVLATATRTGRGGQVLAPLASVPNGAALWLRDGLGRTALANVQQRWADWGLALLDAPALPALAEPAWAHRDGFPGSPAHVVEHLAPGTSQAAWPQLQLGFLGGLRPDDSRALGVALLRGPRGGPVISGQGQLLGVALPHDDGVDRLLPVSMLRSRLDLPATPRAKVESTRAELAAVYEMALPWTLQLIAA